ncbi:O-antigen ligase family protein [Acetobacter sacchari]|uniref:O-antigen ligase family protein n=1 Tax=Acetobacter sacchari TaxID=2661687 RepID=A0ABS3LXZ0_9PROT|nr:O-antigen ligase family protein [Acetobacter sacchari]MBO1360794.1 O-antigen ligase family protein [Acetobacter sacchari]
MRATFRPDRSSPGPVAVGLSRLLGGIAIPATILLPILLFRTRALSDAVVSVVTVLFVLRSAALRDWSWLRARWLQFGLALWGVIVVSSVLAGPASSAIQGVLSVRFFLFAAAASFWTLAGRRARGAAAGVCAALAGWTVLECWQQYLTGYNALGYGRWGDGALTGPFLKPRAGNALLMVMFPGAMPVVLRLLARDTWRSKLVGLTGLLLLIASMILIGQRMANLLMVAGLLLTALLVRRMRLPVIAALGLGVVVLAALPVISPPTYSKLVIKFADQISHFTASPYGQIYTRAAVMVAEHPKLGVGFDGFRFHCLDPQYFHGLPQFDIPFVGPAENGCNIHPHNYYLQVATAAGLPGLTLLMAMILCWLRLIARPFLPSRGAERMSRITPAAAPTPENAMLLVACVVTIWPIASTSALFSLPSGGWVFLIAGWAMAATRGETPERAAGRV